MFSGNSGKKRSGSKTHRDQFEPLKLTAMAQTAERGIYASVPNAVGDVDQSRKFLELCE
jgi:hypothetical protein